jgi:hypothetical protein
LILHLLVVTTVITSVDESTLYSFHVVLVIDFFVVGLHKVVVLGLKTDPP